jgi:hypothetical protein
MDVIGYAVFGTFAGEVEIRRFGLEEMDEIKMENFIKICTDVMVIDIVDVEFVEV